MGLMTGKSALITGAGSGIGRATARLLAAAGAAVTVFDVNPGAGDETVRLIGAAGGTAQAVRGDVRRFADLAAAVRAATGAYGRLDILHNNAYWYPFGRTLLEMTEEEWDRAHQTMLKATWLGCKAALPIMLAQGSGVIVNTASVLGLVAARGFFAYSAAKAGVIALTRAVAAEYGRHGIRANAVCPGIVETPSTEKRLSDPQIRAAYEAESLVGRVGQPDEIARAVLYLASDEAGYVQGAAFVIDGGMSIV